MINRLVEINNKFEINHDCETIIPNVMPSMVARQQRTIQTIHHSSGAMPNQTNPDSPCPAPRLSQQNKDQQHHLNNNEIKNNNNNSQKIHRFDQDGLILPKRPVPNPNLVMLNTTTPTTVTTPTSTKNQNHQESSISVHSHANPITSKQHQHPIMRDLNRELKFNQINGKNVLEQKSELKRVQERIAEARRRKEAEQERLSRRSSLELRLEERAKKLAREGNGG